MRIFGFEITRSSRQAAEDKVVIRSVSPSKTPISRIPTVKPKIMSYAQIHSGGRGNFTTPEYDLAEIGIVEDSVSGHRMTAVKIDGEVKTLSFQELWTWAVNKFSYCNECGGNAKQRIYIPEGKLFVLSGKVQKNLSEEEAKKRKVCRVHECNGKYESRGMCESHRCQYRAIGYIKDKIVGSWEPCTRLIRHKVTKKGYHFIQKHGSTEVTADHSLIHLGQEGLREFKPEENLSIAKIQSLDWEFGSITSLDLANYIDFKQTDKFILDQTPNPLDKDIVLKESRIPRFITGNELFDFIALIGAFISEGSTIKQGKSGFRIHSSNLVWLDDLKGKFEKVFPDISCKIIKTHKREDQFALVSYKNIIASLFSSLCGYGSENKKLPDFIYNLPKEAIQVLNSYLLDGDGNRQSYGWSYTTKSLTLASQYSFLLRLLGHNYNFNYKFKDDKIFYSVRTCLYREKYGYKTWLSPFEYSDEYVYDLEVPTTHNFIDLAGQILLHNTEAFARQAFKKKIGLMFKEGWGYSGKNKDTIQYVKTRMAQIARATSTPTSSLLKKVGRSLIRVSNAYLVKVRDPKASGGQIRKDADGKKLKPVAGYFVPAPETMYIDIDQDTGKIYGWRQELPNGFYKEFPPEDVVHFTIDKREGFIFGVPTLVPVIDDIRALRQIEENVEVLLYQHLFPLFQYKVGTETNPAGFDEEGNKEIDVVKEQIQLMPLEGGIVTPERHEIKAVGAEGRAIRAEGYLEHFKKRVVAGLGISQIDLGDGETANRATARTLSRGLIDAVKDIQDELEAQWDQHVISELLLESTFGEDVLEEENFVHLKFAEIDIDNKMEQEKHASEIFKSYGLTYDEYRAELSLEPIPLPEDPQDQDMSKYPEWAQTYWMLIEQPLNLIRAVDEPWSMAAQAATEMKSLAFNQKQQKVAQAETEKSEKRAAEEDRKTKIAVTKARPKPTSIKKKDHYLSTSFKELERDTVERVKRGLDQRRVLDYDYILSHARTWAAESAKKMNSIAVAQLIRGFNDQTGGQARRAEELLIRGRGEIQDRIERVINRLAMHTIGLVRRRVDSNAQDVTIAGDIQRTYITETHIAFDVSKYRADFIYDVEIRKAYNFGRLLGLRFMDVVVQIDPSDECCDRCKSYASRVEDASFLSVSEVVPIHPGCKCTLKVVHKREKAEPLTDGTTDMPTNKGGSVKQEEKGIISQTAECPNCGATLIYQEETGRYKCLKCNKGFGKEEIKDGTKLESCVLKVKSQLRKKNPSWSEKKIKSSAFAICNAQLKGK